MWYLKQGSRSQREAVEKTDLQHKSYVFRMFHLSYARFWMSLMMLWREEVNAFDKLAKWFRLWTSHPPNLYTSSHHEVFRSSNKAKLIDKKPCTHFQPIHSHFDTASLPSFRISATVHNLTVYWPLNLELKLHIGKLSVLPQKRYRSSQEDHRDYINRFWPSKGYRRNEMKVDFWSADKN